MSLALLGGESTIGNTIIITTSVTYTGLGNDSGILVTAGATDRIVMGNLRIKLPNEKGKSSAVNVYLGQTSSSTPIMVSCDNYTDGTNGNIMNVNNGGIVEYKNFIFSYKTGLFASINHGILGATGTTTISFNGVSDLESYPV
jgi:hypothetical protein